MDRIVIDSRVHFGKPCVKGTRITVRSVLELIEAGIAFDAIVRDYYPELSLDDVPACMHYAVAVVTAEEVHTANA